MKRWLAPTLALALLLAGPDARAEPLTLTARGSVQIAFTPGVDAAGLIIETLGKARRQVLVQAYSLTHKGIAAALVAARRRGLDVGVIADRDQHGRVVTSQVAWLAAQGVPVWLDGDHAAAHDKVMIIDSGTPDAIVITGSFNFSHAAQHRNAENLLILRGHPTLAEAYAANWRRHRAHSLPLHP
jgi:phosphatidylserine/phosphatidylglycerophosphate/cardiolipin synthase-like enzyme